MPLDANGKYVVPSETKYVRSVNVTVPEVPPHLRYDLNPRYPPDKDIGKSLAIVTQEGRDA